jgi:nucleoside-diphosphate-sugar epimerase
MIHRMSECDVVVHLAAISGVMACANDPLASSAVNIDATRELARACADRRVPLAFASSFAVVGIPERLPITEATPARPTHEYARQKAAGEAILSEAGAHPPGRFGIVRMSNLYGAYAIGGRAVTKGNVLTRFVEQSEHGLLQVNAPGTQVRDFIHVDDVVRHWTAIVAFLGRTSRSVSVFNVASGESLSISAAAERFAERWAYRFPRRPALRIETVPNPRGGVELLQSEFQIDRRQTERELGVTCAWTLDRGIDALLPPPEAGQN